MSTTDQTAGGPIGGDHGGEDDGVERRDFLFVAAGGFGAVTAGLAVWPLIDNMNPSADVLALSSIEVNLAAIEVGQGIIVKWLGKPVFIRRRTPEEIAEAEAVDYADLPDPEADSDRVKDGKAEWLVLIGVCTHLGCVPQGTKPGQDRGDYDGWYCPCHGSHYDSSGRIRKGPAPLNLEVPEYTFLDDTNIRIG